MTIEPPDGSSTVVEASRLRRPSSVEAEMSWVFFLPISGKMALSVGEGSFLINEGEVTNC